MPGVRPAVEPLSAGESSRSSASDEVSQLELQSQRQLEEDIARIFDESIYSDLEVVCGKLKILTHSCILKARTHKFYHKLETILHVNIGRNTFDEIYSFISDAYTECNILYEEKEIIKYLDENLGIEKTNVKNSPKNKPEEKDDPEVYSTPNCVSPEENYFQETQNSSPSTELTKEYYALVPIDGDIGDVLDRELIEQDALSNAFHSIHKSQVKDVNAIQNTQCVKPTSLCLDSSHIPEIHSNSCDILKKSDSNGKGIVFDETKTNNDTSHTRTTIEQSEADSRSTVYDKILNLPETSTDKLLDPTYTPDSLITDEPSSSSDYLSAAYAVSPGVVFSCGCSQLNVGENATKMDNIVTISDSGLETAAMLDSLNSCKDVTLTDVSLTDSTLHDIINDDSNCQDSASNTLDKSHVQIIRRSTSLNSPFSGTSTGKDFTERKSNKSSMAEINSTSTKDEKQRLNEEIVIMESSSLSSETGSWEPVFPPKLPEKDMCERFIASERKSALEVENYSNVQHETHNDLCPSLVQKSPYKSTSCFIDAASLADEGDNTLTSHAETNNTHPSVMLKPSTPVPCKRNYGSNDWSDSNENDDSLEQPENIDTDGPNNVSQTIFEMTPTNEDDPCWHAAGYALVEQEDIKTSNDPVLAGNGLVKMSKVRLAISTPNNSIMSVKNIDMSRIDESDSENDFSGGRHDIRSLNPQMGHDEYASDIPSTSVINISSSSSLVFVDNNSSLLGSQSNNSSTKREIENIPIVSGAYIPEPEEIPERPPRAISNSSFWVVDMSSTPKSDISECSAKLNNKPVDKSLEEMRSAPKPSNSGESYKTRCSVDSDSSEKSTHNFYIDLSALPDALTPEQTRDKDEGNEKKNIFSMFIDLGDKSTVAKEMPARFSSTLNTKKNTKIESKMSSTGSKPPKATDFNVVTRCVTTTNHASDDTIMFEKLESLCADPSISISEIKNNMPLKVECPIDAVEANTKQTMTKDNDLFVKLSDLDKPAPKAEPVTNTEKTESRERMSRSIPDSDWRESSLSINLRSNEIISSFHSENALSLNRLFPHLKNDFSRSMPGSLSSRSKSTLRLGVSCSPGDVDERQPSDAWEMSSVDNSATDDMDPTSSVITKCQSRLGQDLLRMFLEETGTDVIVEVSGRRIKAHKCILSSRCQYFAGILSGGWVESAGNVISLPPFSFSVVHFALCHIYSGISMIPNTIGIVELVTLADMLGLEGLKEGIMYMLKVNYCHHFHEPCSLCTAGVLECLPLASVHGLDDLYRKCLQWITKHFQRVWITKAFAKLSFELLEKCYQEHVINLSTTNFVETVLGCGITVSELETSRWSDVVARMCRRLVDAAAQFAAVHLYEVLESMSTVPGDAPPPALHALHDCLSGAIEWAPPEQTCRAYHLLSVLIETVRADCVAQDLACSLLSVHAPTWRVLCEGALVRNAPNVVSTAAFADLPAHLRDRLRDIGCILYGMHAPAPAPILWLPRPQRPALQPEPSARRNLDIDRVRSCFVPYAAKPQPLLGSRDSLAHTGRVHQLPRNQQPAARAIKPREDRFGSKMNRTFPCVRTTKAQEERAKFNSIKTAQSVERVVVRPARATYENTRPRYMEPRQPKEKPPARKSIDSSRNSSPVQRAVRARTSLPPPRPRTADLSADSLNESYNNDKYATYTKLKHNTDGSVEEAHTSVKSHNTAPSNSNTQTVTETGNAKNTKLKKKSSVPASAPLNLESQPVVPSTSANAKNQAAMTPKCRKQVKSTKIPVYKQVKPAGKDPQPQAHLDKSINNSLSPVPQRSKPNDRMQSGSLMSATKSSQAKMVTKTVKETTNTKCSSKQDTSMDTKATKCSSKHDSVEPKTKRCSSKQDTSIESIPSNGKNVASCSHTAEIPVMERSGTFLKDEPLFGDKTTDIDKEE